MEAYAYGETRRLDIPIVHVRKGGVDDVNGLRSAWRQVFPLYVDDIPNAGSRRASPPKRVRLTRWMRDNIVAGERIES